jgi:hypothetical protein
MPSKICVSCGLDVSTQKRVKDPKGQYYCHPCWNVKVNPNRGNVAAPPTATFPPIGDPVDDPFAAPPAPDELDFAEQPSAEDTGSHALSSSPKPSFQTTRIAPSPKRIVGDEKTGRKALRFAVIISVSLATVGGGGWAYYNWKVQPAIHSADKSLEDVAQDRGSSPKPENSEWQKYQANKGAVPEIKITGNAGNILTFTDWKTQYNVLSGTVNWDGREIGDVTYTVKKDGVIVNRGTIDKTGWQKDEPQRVQTSLGDFPKGLLVTINVEAPSPKP